MRYNQPCVCGRSSSGRARPCQGRGSEFEPRRPLQKETPSERMVFLFGIWQRAGLNSLRTPRRSPSCQPSPARCRGAAAGTLPRNRLASSAAGGASALSSSPAPKNKTTQRETLRKEVVSLFAFVSRQNDWFAEKSFYDIIIFR